MNTPLPEGPYHQRWKHSDPPTSERRTEGKTGGPPSYPHHQGVCRSQENGQQTQRVPVLPSSVVAAYATPPSRQIIIGPGVGERRMSDSQPPPSPAQTQYTYDLNRSLESPGGRVAPQSDSSAGPGKLRQIQLQPQPQQSAPRAHQQPHQRSDSDSRRPSIHAHQSQMSTTQNVSHKTHSVSDAAAHSSSSCSPTTSTLPTLATMSNHLPLPPPAPPSQSRSQHGQHQPPPPTQQQQQQQPQQQPVIHPAVAKNAAKALAPIRHLYEQAWSQTVNNVQQEMSRMHTELLAVLDSEHKQHISTREIFSHLKHEHEDALTELDKARAENAELKSSNEDLKAAAHRAEEDVVALRDEVERYALVCQKLRAENHVLDGTLRDAHAHAQMRQQQKQGNVRREDLEDGRRATKEYMDDRLERMKLDFAKQLEAQMAVVLREVQDQKTAREDAERMLKDMRQSPSKPSLIRRGSEAITLVGTPESETMSILHPKQEIHDTSLDFPMKYTTSPTSIDQHEVNVSSKGSDRILVSGRSSPADRPRVERSAVTTPTRPTHASIELSTQQSPLPTPRPSPLLSTHITSSASTSSALPPKRSSLQTRQETEVIDLTPSNTTLTRSTSTGTSHNKPPLAISIPSPALPRSQPHRSDSQRSRPSSSPQPLSPPSPRQHKDSCPVPKPLSNISRPSSPHRSSSSKRSGPPSPRPHRRSASLVHNNGPVSVSVSVSASQSPATSTLNQTRYIELPRPQSQNSTNSGAHAATPNGSKEPHHRGSSPAMASLTPNGNERAVRHPWYGRDHQERQSREPTPSGRGLKRDRKEFERSEDHASVSSASASVAVSAATSTSTSTSARRSQYSWQLPPPPPTASASDDPDVGERPRARMKTDEGARDVKSSVRSAGESSNVDGGGGGTKSAGPATAPGSVNSRWRSGGAPPPPPTSAGATTTTTTSARSNKIGINHMDLLYETKQDKMICRMCRTPNLKDQPTPKSPAVFPAKATWAELVGHCQKTHPKSFEELEKLSPAQVAELRQRMTSSKISGFILG